MSRLALLLLLLPATPGWAADAYCTLPGELVVEGSHAPHGGVPNPVPSLHIQGLYFAEPPDPGIQIAITMKVESLAAMVPYAVYKVFLINDDAHYYVAYDPAAEAPFTYGTTDPDQFVAVPFGEAAPGSGAHPDGTITWLLRDGAILLMEPGRTAREINGHIMQTVPGNDSQIFLSGTDKAAGATYVMRGRESCATDKTWRSGGALPASLLVLLGAIGWRRQARR